MSHSAHQTLEKFEKNRSPRKFSNSNFNLNIHSNSEQKFSEDSKKINGYAQNVKDEFERIKKETLYLYNRLDGIHTEKNMLFREHKNMQETLIKTIDKNKSLS